MNSKRRVLKEVIVIGGITVLATKTWTKPIINSVVLPAHAQSSTCSMTDLVGTWEFTGEVSDYIVELFEDGSSDFILGASWNFSNSGQFLFFIDGGDVIYNGISSADCINLSGSITNFIGEDGEIVPEGIPAGSFSAQKIE